MSIKLEVHFGSFEELAAFSARQVVGSDASAKPQKAVAASKPVEAKAEKTPAPAEEKLDDTGAEESEEDNTIEIPDSPAFDDVKGAILKVNKLKGKAPAVAILKKFGAEKVGPQLKEKDYAAVMEECNKALAA